jgi:L-seryl-tRNA(Ser) seleniumtransferase
MKRRELLKSLSLLPLAGTIGGFSNSIANAAPVVLSPGRKVPVKSIYESIGVRPLINARGTVTVIGGSRMMPEVLEAMGLAVRDYVQIDELMDGVGRRLAELTGAESGCVTAGASAAITAATAGCVTGGDPDKIWMIPNLIGMKDEVIIPSYSRTAYDAAAKAVGVKMIEVSNTDELKSALGPRTAMILVLAGARSENGPLSLKKISSLAKPLGVPVLVDAAAEGLDVPNPHITQGADMVAYSGGKYLRGPQCAGLLIGRKDLIMAARINTGPHHGFGRGFKVGREEIVGMLTAVEMWFKRDHEEENRIWTSWLETISLRLRNIPGVIVDISQPKGRSNHSPNLSVKWDKDKIPLSGEEIEQLLWDGNPRIAVSGAGSFLPFPPNKKPDIMINSSQLEAGEEELIADRVFAVLSDPPILKKPVGIPSVDISGQWDLEMKFSASIVNQTLIFEQKDNELTGSHIADIGPRDLKGTIYGDNILVYSSYTLEGVRVNIAFTGTVTDAVLKGKASLGEYGQAEWKAIRHPYK